MSAVHNNRNEQSRVARQAQTDYQNREQELVKKHRREVARLNQRHVDDVREIKENHTQQVESLKQRSRQALSERDQKYQSEIQEIKSLQVDRSRKVAQEHDRKMRSLDEARDSEIEKLKQVSERQRLRERELSQQDLRQLQQEFSIYVGNSQKQQQSAQRNLREKLQKAHFDERDTILRNSEERISSLVNDRESLKRTQGERIDQLNRQLISQKDSLHADFFERMKTEQSKHQDQLSAKNVVFQDARREMTGKYQAAIAEEKEKSEVARKDLREAVEHRQQNEVNALERKVEKLSQGQVTRMALLKEQLQTEKDNLTLAYKEQVKIFERQRDQALKDHNQSNHSEMRDVRGEYDTQFRTMNEFYLEKINELERTHEERISSVIRDAETERLRADEQTEMRVSNLKSRNEVERLNREEHFRSSIDEAKFAYQEALKDLREKNLDEKNAMLKHFQESMSETQISANKKMNQTISKYETEIQSLRDRHLRELRGLSRQQSRIQKQSERQTEMDKATMKSQYHDQLAQMQESHNKEIQRLNLRHEQEVQELLSVVRES